MVNGRKPGPQATPVSPRHKQGRTQMASFDRNFAAAARQTARLEAALAEWEPETDDVDMPADLARALWADTSLPNRVIQHEERLQGWLN